MPRGWWEVLNLIVGKQVLISSIKIYRSLYQHVVKHTDGSLVVFQNTLYTVESLIKNHDGFEKTVRAQEDRIEEMKQFADDLVEQKHYAADEIKARSQAVLSRRDRMWETSRQRRKKLEDSRNYQLFLRNLYEVSG